MLIKTKTVLTSIWKDVKNIVDKRIEPSTSGFRTTVTPNICIIQNTNSADVSSARHGQFQENEKITPTTELNIFLTKKNFDEK